MRLVQVAKLLGMTGQQLRHELTEVNFGVKPTDREVPDNLAQGIIRFVARKHGLTIDFENLGFTMEEEAPAASESDTEEAEEAPAADAPASPTLPRSAPKEAPAVPATSLHVLRKLSLEDVSKEAIAKQEQEMKRPTKAEREEQLLEDRALNEAKKLEAATVTHQQQIKRKEGIVSLPALVTVKEFAEKTGVQVPKVVQTLMKNGVLATINQSIDYDTAAIIAAELGVTVQKELATVSAEHLHTSNLEELLKDEPELLKVRPPIVVVMGHVDHGKTSILDAIRQTDVVAGEAGGITQHIGAYQVVHAVGKEMHPITFLDTPGHEAFTAMRARGAHVTDIAVIVVSAEEGVKPTTIEAIHHAKEADVPIIVAINKIDKPNADPERVKGEMAAEGLQPEEWGGTVPYVPCSAVTKMGITDLLDAIVLIAEEHPFKANPDRPAVATVIESQLDPSLGPLGTIIINAGHLSVGDIFVCGNTSGKVRSLTDARGAKLTDVSPSAPARVSGFNEVPRVGDIFQVVPSEQQARSLLEELQDRRADLVKRSFADLVSRLSEGKLTQLKVVLKADAQGSLEAIQEALAKCATEEVQVKVIHAAIGGVTESDVMMAAASDGIVISFNAPVSPAVLRTAEREGVEVRPYSVVYTLLDDVEGLVKGLVEPVEEEQILGHLEVKGVFLTKKSEQIIGGRVTDGIIKRLPFRLQRPSTGSGQASSGELEVVGTGRIMSLKHVDKDIKEAKEGTECGMRVDTSVPILEGDVLEVYLKELKKKES